MARKRFTERQVLETLLFQRVTILCYRCKLPFLTLAGAQRLAQELDPHYVGWAEREHVTELCLGGGDGPANCRYSCRDSHRIVTNGTKATSAGSSKQKAAKVKRILGLTCNGPKQQIRSRGFSKESRPMSRPHYDNTKRINEDL